MSDKKELKKTIQAKMLFIEAQLEFTANISAHFDQEDCPLGDVEHYDRSHMLFGMDCYKWTCEFCGKEHCC